MGLLSVMYCHTAWGHWAVELLQCTVTPPRGGGQWTCCNARAHQLGGRGVLPRRRLPPKDRNSYMPTYLPTTLRRCGSALREFHFPLPLGKEAVYCRSSTAHCPHAVRQCISGKPAMCGPTNWGDGESCPGGGRFRKSGPPAMHCLTPYGQCAVQFLQYTAILPRGSWQWNFCNALPPRLGAVGSGTSATHYLTTWGQWAVEILQSTTLPPGGSGLSRAMHCPTA